MGEFIKNRHNRGGYEVIHLTRPETFQISLFLKKIRKRKALAKKKTTMAVSDALKQRKTTGLGAKRAVKKNSKIVKGRKR